MLYLFILFVPVILFLYWCFVVGLISLTGGWFFLAKKYPPPDNLQNEKETYNYQSVYLNLISRYSMVITVKIYDEGIYLRPLIFFKFMHKPVFIKWEMINRTEIQKFLFTQLTIFFNTGKIKITGSSAEKIQEIFADKKNK